MQKHLSSCLPYSAGPRLCQSSLSCCTAAQASRSHVKCSQRHTQNQRLQIYAGVTGASAEQVLSDEPAVQQQQQQQEAAGEGAMALLQLLRVAALLTAAGFEVSSLLRYNAAERAAQQSQALSQYEAARHAAQQTSRQRGRQQAVLAEATEPVPPPPHGIGSYALERGSTWAVLLVLLCGALLNWLRRPRCVCRQM
jgi:hypothetical protein